jgi:hypothetical protein
LRNHGRDLSSVGTASVSASTTSYMEMLAMTAGGVGVRERTSITGTAPAHAGAALPRSRPSPLFAEGGAESAIENGLLSIACIFKKSDFLKVTFKN